MGVLAPVAVLSVGKQPHRPFADMCKLNPVLPSSVSS